MANVREVLEAAQEQGINEVVVWSVTVDPAPSSGTPEVTVLDESADYADVTATVMPSGLNSYSGDVITCKPLQSLTVGHWYRILVRYTAGDHTLEPYFRVKASR